MHEVIYYTVEDGGGQIFKEFDTLFEAFKWFKLHRKKGMQYICGFKQLRDADNDVLDEITVYEKKVA